MTLDRCRHGISPITACSNGCAEPALRALITTLVLERDQYKEERDQARQLKLHQYHVVPNEDSAECRIIPWHSPHCYEQSRSAVNEDNCTCGLTKLKRDADQMRNDLNDAVQIVKALFHATELIYKPKVWGSDQERNAHEASETAQKQAASWVEKMKIRY